MLAAALSSALALFDAATDPCAPMTDCTDCIAKVSQGCGWCSPSEVIYEDGTKGHRCANANDPKKWFCLGKLMTAECEVGYVCTGPPDYKCELSGKPGEGTVDLHACIDGCTQLAQWKCNTDKYTCEVCTAGDKGCTDHQTCSDACIDESTYKCDPVQAKCVKCAKGEVGCQGEGECDNKCTQLYQCDIPTDTTKEPTCNKCTDPTGQKCTFSSVDTCKAGDGKTTFGCDWQYECKCGSNGPTCAKTAHGIPKLEWCTEQCKCDTTYTCDESAKMCKPSNSTGGGGSTNITQCNANCPTKPQNHTTPYELRGVWRGLAIQQKFGTGEWVANISKNSTTIYKPDGTTYFSGLTSTYKPTGSGGGASQLWVESTEGTLKGTIKLLYQDYGLEPELMYVQLAVDESALTTPPKDFDTAMTAASHKVLGMYKCKSDSKNCKFHLPTTPPIDMVESRGRALQSTGDKCNAYSDCKTCLAATAGDLTCGWCTTPVEYINVTSAKYQCAGWQVGQHHQWKCYGQFRTATCHDYCCDNDSGKCSECSAGKTGLPTPDMCASSCKPGPSPYGACGFNGTYRGLEIDLGYLGGEWTADFNVTSQMAKFTFLKTGYSYSGKIGCTALDKDDGAFQLTLTNGTKLYGIYATGSNQAETVGLSWALSQLGSTVPPLGWDSAMLGTNATVFGYTKCADYKAGICKF
jgi:hypothetical protein